MINNEQTLLLRDTESLLNEIEGLKRQLNDERRQKQHWEELAMVFHDALWNELRLSKTSL